LYQVPSVKMVLANAGTTDKVRSKLNLQDASFMPVRATYRYIRFT
jgi:hypothetical protein